LLFLIGSCPFPETAVAQGALTQKIIGVAIISGETLTLVNPMIVGHFADEVKIIAREVGMAGKLNVQAEAGNVQGT
jgi:hypothetical protein